MDDDLSYGLGPLCLWQCFFILYVEPSIQLPLQTPYSGGMDPLE